MHNYLFLQTKNKIHQYLYLQTKNKLQKYLYLPRKWATAWSFVSLSRPALIHLLLFFQAFTHYLHHTPTHPHSRLFLRPLLITCITPTHPHSRPLPTRLTQICLKAMEAVLVLQKRRPACKQVRDLSSEDVPGPPAAYGPRASKYGLLRVRFRF